MCLEALCQREASGWVSSGTLHRLKEHEFTRYSFGSHAVHSRAYCLMANHDTLIQFYRNFDGHIFRSKKGELACDGIFAAHSSVRDVTRC